MGRNTLQEAVLTAVRTYCIECSGGSRKEADRCSRRDCPLHPYRSCRALAKQQPAKPGQVQLHGQMDIADFLH